MTIEIFQCFPKYDILLESGIPADELTTGQRNNWLDDGTSPFDVASVKTTYGVEETGVENVMEIYVDVVNVLEFFGDEVNAFYSW